MADLKISELSSLSGANLAAADELAIVDSSASETKKITVSNLISSGAAYISDDSIPGAKILFGSAEIAGTALENSAVASAQLADDAVTAAKIADEATVDLVTTLPVTGAFIGQIALDTVDNKIYIWDGSVWQSVKGAGSVNTIIGSTSGVINLSISTSGDQVTITTSLDNTNAAKQFLAGPTGAAGAATYRTIEGTDLPFAGATETGGVQVSGDGLRMDTGRIEIDNDVTATGGSYKIVDVNAKGLVTGYKDIESADLPIATDATPGVVSPGTDLDVSAAGVLNHEEKIAGGGTFTKVTVNATGHITAGTTLAEADVPSLNASKIGAGVLPTARVADDAITGAKLADYSISKIAESAPTAEYIGQLFFNPLDRTLFMWDGNVYQPIGVSYGQVIFSGTYSAATNLITSITPDGAAIGLAVGASLVSPVAATRSHYVVIDEAGTGSAPAPAVSLSPPDILLSTGSDWVLLDVSDTVTAQLASNVQVTPAGNISSTNVQAALQELDTEKLQLTGGTLTGDLNLGVDVNVTFEGANANQYETTLTVADPTADNTVTIPDESGTVVTTGSSGVVTSTMITDGTIVDADISSSAEIEVSKLVDGSARQLLQTDAAGTGVEWASNIDIPGTLDVTGATVLDGGLNVDSGTLVVDATNNKVGIGTSSPGAPLEISNTSPRIRFNDTDGTNTYSEITATTGSLVLDSRNNTSNGQIIFRGLGGGTASEYARVDSSGRLLVGTSSSRSNAVVTSNLQIEGSGADASLSIIRNGGSNGSYLQIGSTGGTTQGSLQATRAYQPLSQIVFSGSDGSAIRPGAYISALNDRASAWASSDCPTRLEFSTTADGATSPTERLVIDSSGNAIFAADATINSITIGRGAGNVSTNNANGYQALYSNTTGAGNTANGYQALYSNTTGAHNTANGYQALYSNTTGYNNVANGVNALFSNTTGAHNTANGRDSLFSNTTGGSNTANGYQALYSNTTGVNNTANGLQALFYNTTGSSNTANGYNALYNNTTGNENTANGYAALYLNTTGNNNSADGFQALYSNTIGYSNTANGYQALYSNTTGYSNTANGLQALYNNTTGVNNTANGRDALFSNTTGSYNTANGYQALYFNTTGSSNTADGRDALRNNTTGDNNVANGKDSLYYNTTGSGNIGIGFQTSAGTYAPVFNPTTENNRLILGHTAITNAYVKVAWTVTSDERDKMNFAPVPYGLDFVNQLKPTAYQFKVDRDTETPNGDVRYGFKAQDILALEGDNPVIIDTEDADHLKYKGEHLVPVLVNAVQELTAMVNELKSELAALKGV